MTSAPGAAHQAHNRHGNRPASRPAPRRVGRAVLPMAYGFIILRQLLTQNRRNTGYIEAGQNSIAGVLLQRSFERRPPKNRPLAGPPTRAGGEHGTICWACFRATTDQVTDINVELSYRRHGSTPGRVVYRARAQLVRAPVRVKPFQDQVRRADQGHPHPGAADRLLQPGPERPRAARRRFAGAGAANAAAGDEGRHLARAGRQARHDRADQDATRGGRAHRTSLHRHGENHPPDREKPVFPARRNRARGQAAGEPNRRLDPLRPRARHPHHGRQDGRGGTVFPFTERDDAVDDDRARHRAAVAGGRRARHGRLVPRRRQQGHPEPDPDETGAADPGRAQFAGNALSIRCRTRPAAAIRSADPGHHRRTPRVVRRQRLSGETEGGGRSGCCPASSPSPTITTSCAIRPASPTP